MKENKNNNGYILLSADGTKPNCTLAALMTDDGTNIIAEGKISDFISMLGSIARTLIAECDVPKDIVLAGITAAAIAGDAWEGIMDMMSKKPSEETIDTIKNMFMQD